MTPTLSGDTIIITEKESTSLCSCCCLFDIEMTVSGVENQSYIIKFVEDYAEDLQQILFQADLNNSSTGEYNVVRIRYPWGQ